MVARRPGTAAVTSAGLPQNQDEDPRKSESRYCSLFTHIDSGFCIVEVAFDEQGRPRDYRFLEVNPAFERLTGLSNAVGKWMRELVPDHEQHWYETYGRIAETGVPERFVQLATALDRRWYDVHAFRIDEPAAHRVAVLFNDITDLKRTQQSLQMLNESLERLVSERTMERDRIWQVSQDLLGIADVNGVWLSVNPAWTRTLGWAATDIVGRTAEWIAHPDEEEKICNELRSLRAGKPTRSFETRLRGKSGDYHLLSWTVVPLEGRLYAVARDITEERARESSLRDFEDFTRLALTAVGGVGVWTQDIPANLYYCDPGIAELYGLDPDEAAQGIPRALFISHVHPEDLPNLPSVKEQALGQADDVEVEFRIRHPNGSIRWVLSRAHTYVDETNTPIRRSGVSIETTKQRQLEEQFRQSQKMESLGQLTGGIAHDFNNFLQGILGSISMARRLVVAGRPAEIERFLETATRSTQRAAALTHRLLAFARRQPLAPRLLDVNELVLSTEDLLKRTIGESIRLKLTLAPDLWVTRCDSNQLENALLNLVINARDAIHGLGEISIETCNVHLNAGRGGGAGTTAKEAEIAPGDYVCVSVSDTGTGMSQRVIERAFDPFFTTKPQGQGTGLGLSMIYGFARQSQGHARITSELGRGSTVKIYLPRHHGTLDGATAESEAATVRPCRNVATVLVVEDEMVVRDLIVEVLKDLGYHTLRASDGAEALEILRSPECIDLLLTDVGLPNINGRQLAEAARVNRKSLKVLFMTGYAERAELLSDALEAGMELITKPFQVEALSQRVAEMLRTEGADVFPK
jgi:PAS domain S-box-containing protein